MTINTSLCLCLVYLVFMALLTLLLFMPPYQGEFSLLIMIQCRLFPVFCLMTSIAAISQLLFMRIILLVTIKAAVRQGLVFSGHMAFFTGSFCMLPIEFESGILRGVVVKEGGLPPFHGMTCLTLPVFKLPFMGVLVAVRVITALVIQRLVTPLHVTLLTGRLYMFSFELIAGIFRRRMIKEGRFPTFYVMAGLTDLICKLPFLRVIVAS